MRRPVNLWFALLGLGSNKLRASLTVLGIIIGVGAVIMIVSLGNGLRRATKEQMEVWGRGTIEVRPSMSMAAPAMVAMSGGMVTAVDEKAMYGSQPRTAVLNDRDVDALRRLGSSLDGLSPEVSLYGTVVYRGQQAPIWETMGVVPDWLHVYRRELHSGRFISEADMEAAAAVAVIDELLIGQFFGENSDPVGQVVHLTVNQVTQSFTIVGVLKSDREYSRTSNQLLVPLRTAQLRLQSSANRNQYQMIGVRVDSRDPEQRKYAVAEINTILRARHGLGPGTPEDFTVNDSLQYSEEMTRVTDLMTLVLSLIAGISLIVGTIGMMNIMLVSVSERTWEVGLRRALGARRADVLSQFLGEAVLLSLGGGLIGMGIGIGGSYAVGGLIGELSGYIAVTYDIVAIALVVSSVVGVLSGIYPAWRAARLQPTQALRQMA